MSQNRANTRTQTEPQTEPSPSSSSSVLNIENITTTLILEKFEWLNFVNLEAVQSVGITKSVLKRCFDLYPSITPENLEELVFRFTEFMREPKNRVQNARGFFIGLAKQLSEGITPLDHIETPSERYMREYTERVREKRERMRKLEDETVEFEFEEWLSNISNERRLELVPENQFAKTGSAPYRASIKQYFLESVWPGKRQQIIEGKAIPPVTTAVAFRDSEKN